LLSKWRDWLSEDGGSTLRVLGMSFVKGVVVKGVVVKGVA
jgi:hypothetical protein